MSTVVEAVLGSFALILLLAALILFGGEPDLADSLTTIVTGNGVALMPKALSTLERLTPHAISVPEVPRPEVPFEDTSSILTP